MSTIFKMTTFEIIIIIIIIIILFIQISLTSLISCNAYAAVICISVFQVSMLFMEFVNRDVAAKVFNFL
jgi:uncharacterized MnhB-related membrane protein